MGRDWTQISPYAQHELARHAAEAGRLHEVLLDPGFLLVAEREGLYRQRRLLGAQTKAAQQAFEAFEQASANAGGRRWQDLDDETRRQRLHAEALKFGCASLAEALSAELGDEWRPVSAIWGGASYITIDAGGKVLALDRITQVDGSELIVSLGASGLNLWDPETLTLAAHLRPNLVRGVDLLTAFTLEPGHSLIAYSNTEGFTYPAAIQVWETSSGRIVSEYALPKDVNVRAMRFTVLNGGKIVLVVGRSDGRLVVWDLEAEQVLAESEPKTRRVRPEGPELTVPVTALAELERPTSHLVAGRVDGWLELWSVPELVRVAETDSHHRSVGGLSVLNRGGSAIVASGGVDSQIRFWNNELVSLGSPLDQESSVEAVHFFEDVNSGARLASVGQSLRIWPLDTDQPEIFAHTSGQPLAGMDSLTSWRGLGGRSLLATSDQTSQIQLWAASKRPPGNLSARQLHTREVLQLQRLPLEDGRMGVVSAGMDGTLRTWDIERGVAVGDPVESSLVVLDGLLTIVHEGRPAVCAWSRDALEIWHFRGGQLSLSLSKPVNPEIRAMSGLLYGDTTMLVAVLADGLLTIWVSIDGDLKYLDIATDAHGGDPLSIVAYPSDGRGLAATGGMDGLVQLWEPGIANDCLATAAPGVKAVRDLVTLEDPDGVKYVAAVGARGEVALLDANVSSVVSRWSYVADMPIGHLHEAKPCSLAAPSGGEWLALTRGSTISIWDPWNDELVAFLGDAHRWDITALIDFTWSDGRPGMLTACTDRSIFAWER